jgi:8-oxo-dGTP diphosphatase
MTSESFDHLNLRPAVRALMVDPSDRVLLVRFEFNDVGTVWATPGGGIEPGEETMEALRRELAEEVGLYEPDVGPCVWIRTHTNAMGSWDGQRDEVYLVRCDAFEPTPMMTWDQLRSEGLHEIRWWTLNELEIAMATTLFAPRELVSVVTSIVRTGPPSEPHILRHPPDSAVSEVENMAWEIATISVE